MPRAVQLMPAVRLHGPKDLRVEEVPVPGAPGHGAALIRVTAVGICGSELHTWADGRIGDSVVKTPMILGHEFAGVVEAVGAEARDGFGKPLKVGTRAAIEPAQACGHCEFCQKGNPNLCENLHFCATYPKDGCLTRFIQMPAHNCFPVPAAIDDEVAVMLEPLGVALHATDLARVRVGSSAAIVGAGPIGLCLLQTVKLAGASRVYITDRLPWRLKLAEKLGGIPINVDKQDPAKAVQQATGGRGVDVALEAAWADGSIQQAAELVRRGGTLVLVGIPGDDQLHLKHSTVRRKGLTIMVVRRMKHTYPRALELALAGAVDLKSMISHRVPLEEVPDALAMNAAYQDNVVKIIVNIAAPKNAVAAGRRG